MFPFPARASLVALFLCLVLTRSARSDQALAVDKEASSVERVRYTQSSWNMSDGLPRNAVHSILQTKDGYLWVGTTAGIARFDGRRFDSFKSNLPTDLNAAFVRQMAQTPDGAVWMAAESKGLISYRDGAFAIDPGFVDTSVRCVYAGADGAVWVGTTNGAARIQGTNVSWLKTSDGLPREDVLAICEDLEGNVWIGTGGGLVRYASGKIREHFHDKYFLPVNQVRFLFCDRRGALWVGTSGGGVARMHKGKWSYFKKEHGLPDLFVTAIHEDQGGEVWACTLGGLARFHQERFIAEFMEEGIADEAVYSLTEDHEGSLWIGTKEGLHQLRRQVFVSYTRQNGLAHNNVLAVRADDDDDVWVATWGGGINRIRDEVISLYNSPHNQLADLILSICQSANGTLWFGADYDSGLFRCDETSITRFHAAHGLKDPAVRVIHEDSKGTLWVGTSGALYRQRNGKFDRFTTQQGLPGNTVRCIAEDAFGRLWIGTSGGLASVRTSTGSNSADTHQPLFTSLSKIPSKTILAIHPDPNGEIWVSTEGGGISRFDVTDPQHSVMVRNYSTEQGLPTDTVYEIIEDDRGYLWLTSLSGISRIRKADFGELDRRTIATLSSVVFGKVDGMASEQCNGVSKPAAWKTKDGRLWFATTRGVAVVNPADVRETSPPPQILIEAVLADRKPISFSTKTNSASSSLVIAPGNGELEIRFTALSFKAPGKNLFRYKLEGLDSIWQEGNGRRAANYNHLPPGQYSFRVIGSNSDGVWNHTGSTLHLTLLPHFWQTRWFLAFGVVAGVLSVASAGRYAAWSMLQRRLRRLEQQHSIEKERARIAQDMHDDLGARLSEILFLSELTRKPGAKPAEIDSKLNRISGAAKDLVDNLDAIVWAVNPKNDSFDRFVFYLLEYAPRYLECTNLRCLFDVAEPLPRHPIGSAIRHNLFLVVKEALHNAVKHSGAREVKIAIRLEMDQLALEIADDGNGLPESIEHALGNGLGNMRHRTETIGGTFTIASKRNEGTKIIVRVPLHFSTD